MTRYDKVLILALLAIALFGFYQNITKMVSPRGNYAIIMVNGKEHSKIDLKNNGPREFTITTSRGYNSIEVGNNRIRIKEASCPDQVCVKEGWINKVNEMTVCIPNRVYIKIVGRETEIDDIAY